WGPRSIGNGINHPLPARTPAFHIHGPCSATAFVNLHSPVIAVGRKCEHKSECGCEHHAGEQANQIYAHHLSFPHSSLYLSFVTRRQAGSLRRCLLIKQLRCSLAFSEPLMVRKEFPLRQTTNKHELQAEPRMDTDVADVRNQEARSTSALEVANSVDGRYFNSAIWRANFGIAVCKMFQTSFRSIPA